MSRRDLYKKPVEVSSIISSVDDKEIISIYEERIKKQKRTPKLTEGRLYDSMKELIFDCTNGKPEFYAISYTINTFSMTIELDEVFQPVIDENNIEDDVLHILAMAMVHSVPVYPNKSEVEEELKKYYGKLFTDGFKMSDGSGKKIKLKFTNKAICDPTTLATLGKTIEWKTYSPGEMALIKETIIKEMSKYDSIKKILIKLDYAIDGLDQLLSSAKRNENALQRHITNNPILFGTEYRRIIPKHKFGSDYEADYVLERIDGMFDLVEIESSSLKLYGKNGNPTQYLVHAEQQVLDWTQWIDKNGPYAREKISNLYSPRALIVIGRKESLSEKDRERMLRRNIEFKDTFTIMTYDDLLERARIILKLITQVKD